LCVNWQHRVHPLELCLIVFCLPAPPSQLAQSIFLN
jgi:hypothetical protein